MLIELVDGGIQDFYRDKSQIQEGCPTCDYGGLFLNEFGILLTNKCIKFEITRKYDYALSEGLLIKFFAENLEKIKGMTEIEFTGWVVDAIPQTVEENTTGPRGAFKITVTDGGR